jgi:protein-S-isoprenylcysteine O-methyltransferase Ste14
MLWLRGLIFTILVPGAIAWVLPALADPGARLRGGIWNAGWLAISAGALLYAASLVRFLAAGGTPAIFLARRLRFLIGEEPSGLVSTGLYRYSRNPMYLAVVLAVLGEAILFASVIVAALGCVLFAFFFVIVVLVEEPHLRAKRGCDYEQYCRTVPRWFGRARG